MHRIARSAMLATKLVTKKADSKISLPHSDRMSIPSLQNSVPTTAVQSIRTQQLNSTTQSTPATVKGQISSDTISAKKQRADKEE